MFDLHENFVNSKIVRVYLWLTSAICFGESILPETIATVVILPAAHFKFGFNPYESWNSLFHSLDKFAILTQIGVLSHNNKINNIVGHMNQFKKQFIISKGIIDGTDQSSRLVALVAQYRRTFAQLLW